MLGSIVLGASAVFLMWRFMPAVLERGQGSHAVRSDADLVGIHRRH